MSRADDQQVGAMVREFRDVAGLSQAQLAHRLLEEGLEGIYPQTIAKIESGNRALRYTEAVAMARTLGVSTEDFSPLAQTHGADRAAERHVRRCITEVEEQARDFDDVVARLLLARGSLENAVAAVKASVERGALPRPGLIGHAEEVLLAYTVEALLAQNEVLSIPPDVLVKEIRDGGGALLRDLAALQQSRAAVGDEAELAAEPPF